MIHSGTLTLWSTELEPANHLKQEHGIIGAIRLGGSFFSYRSFNSPRSSWLCPNPEAWTPGWHCSARLRRSVCRRRRTRWTPGWACASSRASSSWRCVADCTEGRSSRTDRRARSHPSWVNYALSTPPLSVGWWLVANTEIPATLLCLVIVSERRRQGETRWRSRSLYARRKAETL